MFISVTALLGVLTTLATYFLRVNVGQIRVKRLDGVK